MAITDLILRLIQAVVIYTIGAWCAILFVLKTVIETVFDPYLWPTRTRIIAPAALDDPHYGRHGYAEVNGVKLHYVEDGNPKNRLMLFIHGFPEFWYSWRYQMEEFRKDYRVVALDMRGYGRSSAPSNRSAYQLDILVEDVRSFVTHLGYDTVTLVGHDWGAVIGFQFVQKHMNMIDRYIMMGAPSLTVMRRLLITSVTQLFKSWYTFFFLMPWLPEFYIRHRDFRYIEENMRHLNYSDLEIYKYTFSAPQSLTSAINYYRENFSFLQKEETLPSIVLHSPGLFLWGQNDKFISEYSGFLLKESIPLLTSKVVIGSGHYMQQDQPTMVNIMIRHFLEKPHPAPFP